MSKNDRQTVFEKNGTSEGYWRWLVDPMWHHCASMYHEAYLSGYAENNYQRYHHLRACLYFAIGMVEAFLNKEQTALLEKEGLEEEQVIKKLKGSFYEKTLWLFPEGVPDSLHDTWQDLLALNDIRAEITHPRRKDHAIYRELDSACAYAITEKATEFIVGALEQQNKPFPYWMLGWNFVGVNDDNTEPFPNNNAQFKFALRAMGYDVPASDYYRAETWEKENMMSLDGFRKLRNIFDLHQEDIQPAIEYFKGLPTPRLTRRWWDKEFLFSVQEGNQGALLGASMILRISFINNINQLLFKCASRTVMQ